jgi:peptidoglycan/LPS O-acetylase OafA/YrhL
LIRFKALTGFRCLAACLVFIYHNRKYWHEQLPPQLINWFSEFHIGVALFFVLSGFLISYTYADEPMRSGKAYSRYILLRLARIMPLYWLILTFYYFDHRYGNREFSWLTYSLAHGFSERLNLDGIAQAWSLTVEMTFYIFAPLLCLLKRKHFTWLIIALIILFAISWLTGIAWLRINNNPHHFFYPLQFISESLFTGRCTEFLAGMLLAAAVKNERVDLFKRWRYKTLVGFTGIFVTAWCISLFQSAAYEDGVYHPAGMLLHKIVLPFLVVILLAGLIYEKTWLQHFFSSKVLLLLGNASFAFYLVHISYVNLKLREYFLLPDRNFIVLWLVAIVLYLVFEKPVYDICRRLLKN